MKLDRSKVECIMADFGIGMMQLAELSGITHKTLKKALDTGGSNPVTCGKIANALGVQADEIIKKDTVA